MFFFRCLAARAMLGVVLGGCAASPPMTPSVAPVASVPVPQLLPVAQRSDDGASAFIPQPGLGDEEKLARLLDKRLREYAADYPIGPGDVVEISVPAMEELSSRTVRVGGDGMISLPFVGSIQARGMTEKSLGDEIRRRLSEKYMYNPQVNLFVREYRSRQVAVVGAVQKPGVYNLSSEADTLIDVISMAGGMMPEAAPRVHFIPAEPLEGGQATQIASIMSNETLMQSSSPLLKGADPLVIDLSKMTKGGGQGYLAMPARPGDVIMVPGAGEVLVQGWVEKPGSYKVTPGLTVLGAVAAAGGSHFAGDTSSVKIIRTVKSGEKVAFLADIGKISQGESADPRVEEGDVIEVSSSTVKIVPYGFYKFMTTIFRVGTSFPIY